MNLGQTIKRFVYGSGLYIPYSIYKTEKARKQLKEEGLQSILNFDYRPYKTSDTLFFLGSGYSASELSEENWNYVAQHDSIGLNNWIYHFFVPTYYVMETPLTTEYFPHVKESINLRKKEYENVPFFIQYYHYKKSANHYNDLEIDSKMIFYNAPYMPNTTNPLLVKLMLEYWSGISNKTFKHLVHYASSLSYVLMMGAMMGYKKLILIGVDMNDKQYYFHHKNTSERAKEFAKLLDKTTNLNNEDISKAKYYSTDKKITNSFGCLPFDDYLVYLKEALLKEGMKIQIVNKKSKLYPLLEGFDFPK